MSKPHEIEISLKYLVSIEGDENASEQDLAFRLGYDEAEIPVSDDVLVRLRDELSTVLPGHLRLDRVGGELSLNGARVKSF
jgi:hypothetical protein